jgi:hypothetical protein
VLVIFILLSVAAWWFLHEDPEAEVRDAHQELTRLLSKTEGEASSTIIFNARVLQNMFADTCEVTGDAEILAGSYTPEEMVSTIIRVQGLFLSIDLTFHELVIEFPAADDAIVNFTAVLVGRTKMEGEEEAAETREVISRMRKVEDKWLFAEFSLAKVLEN